MTDIDEQIQAHIQQFVAELTDLLRESAVTAVTDALGGNSRMNAFGPEPIQESSWPAPSTSKPKRVAKKKVTTKTRKTAQPKARKAKGGRRSPAEMQKQQDELVAYIGANPGEPMEKIVKALGVTSGEMNRPINRLIESGKVRREGQRRASRYFVASGKKAA